MTALPTDLRAANDRLIEAVLLASELAEKATHAETIFNALPDAIVRYDEGRAHLYVNAAMERLVGRSRQELLGASGRALGLENDPAAAWEAQLTEAFATGKASETSFTRATDRGPRFFHARVIPEPNARGVVTSVVVLARDVTDSELYRRAREDADRIKRLQSVTAAFSQATTPAEVAAVLARNARESLLADRAVVVRLDRKREKLVLASWVGYSEIEIKQWEEIPITARTLLSKVVRDGEPLFLTRDAFARTATSVAIDGRHGEAAAVAVVPLTFNGEPIGAVAAWCGDDRAFSSEDRDFVVTLAQHCAQAMERARVLESESLARLEAEKANTLKDEFLATISHELRTPLNAIVGWAAVLQEHISSGPELAVRAIGAIRRNALAQSRLVEDVLDLSRSASGTLKLLPTEVDVAEVVEGALDVVRGAAAERTITLRTELDVGCRAIADVERLQQIVWNVVGNAVKFSHENGHVEVRVRQEASNVLIEVADDGAGIDASFLPYVFDKFRQADGTFTRRYGGLGLGLSIVRELVELHRGTVTATSRGIDRGALFVIALPAISGARGDVRASWSMPAAGRALEGDLALARVLIIDDDREGREALASILELYGGNVVSANSARAAFAQLALAPPDLIVCDIGMPETDGYEFLKRLRASGDAASHVPAIALTGFAREADVHRAREAGFQAHIAKPMDPAHLLREILKLLEAARRA